MSPDATTSRVRRLREMIVRFCSVHCGMSDGELCGDCRDLISYAERRASEAPDAEMLQPEQFEGQYRVMLEEVAAWCRREGEANARPAGRLWGLLGRK